MPIPIAFKQEFKDDGQSGSAGAGCKAIQYERRRPEDTVLYQLVQEHLETFLAQVEGETGAGLPKFVKAEFDAFLQRGIFAHGSGVTD